MFYIKVDMRGIFDIFTLFVGNECRLLEARGGVEVCC